MSNEANTYWDADFARSFRATAQDNLPRCLSAFERTRLSNEQYLEEGKKSVYAENAGVFAGEWYEDPYRNLRVLLQLLEAEKGYGEDNGIEVNGPFESFCLSRKRATGANLLSAAEYITDHVRAYRANPCRIRPLAHEALAAHAAHAAHARGFTDDERDAIQRFFGATIDAAKALPADLRNKMLEHGFAGCLAEAALDVVADIEAAQANPDHAPASIVPVQWDGSTSTYALTAFLQSMPEASDRAAN